MYTGKIIALFALAISSVSFAQATGPGNVELSRSIFVERGGLGGAARTLETTREFRAGDTIVLMVRWTANAQNRGFVVSSPVPATLDYRNSSLLNQTVSVDGGRNWGRLASLRIIESGRIRTANPQDVTHLRWHISAREAARGSGQFTYSAIVKRFG